MPQAGNRGGFSFLAMVGVVMALLKGKEKYDQYREVAADDDEGRIALRTADPLEEEHPRLNGEGYITLDTELPQTRAKRPQKKKACCLCCGIDCSLFFKALGIVIGLYTIYLGFKAVKWAMTESPTGLEGMPTFGESLGCSDASFIYDDKIVKTSAFMGTQSSDHQLDIRGHGVGTIVLADGDASTDEIKYEILIKANQKDLLSEVSLNLPSQETDGTVSKSRFLIQTANMPSGDENSCMKYDVKIFVPPKLKKLHVAVHTPVQIQFEHGAKLNLDDLYVTVYSLSDVNMILPTQDIVANKIALEVYRGWIVGEAPIVEETSISTQRGDGVANVKFYPTLPSDPTAPKKAVLTTSTGAGRSDFYYISNPGFKRPISSTHLSARNADVYLTYKQAHFDGKIKLNSKSYTSTGTQPYSDANGEWTHYVGSSEGEDRIDIDSRGWTGLYF